MERLYGCRREEVEGRSWQALEKPSPGDEDPPPWFKKALRGEISRHRAEIVSRDGRHQILALEITVVGHGDEQGVLLMVEAASPVQRPGQLLSGADLDYSVEAAAHEFGKLRELALMGGVAEGFGRTCYSMLHERERPCHDCPALGPVIGPWPRTSVRRGAPHSDRVELVTAELVDGTTIRLRVRVINDRELTAIHDAKIAALSRRANLTERETMVLGHLLAGRSLEDIAALLSVSRRTVKFHQGNILQKLGVDSRIDLIRLTGF